MKLNSLLLATSFLLGTAVFNPVVASTTPSYPSCIAPTGTVKASYPGGNHGIVGDTSLHTGSDTVYTLSGESLMQCFCGEDGKGIQTNWYRIPETSEQEISVLESQGWIYIPSGAAWGLDDVPYMAKNSDYSCKSTTTTSGGDGRTDGLTDGRTDGRSDGLGSIVQAARGTSLASTGNILFIAEVFTAGVLMTLAGLYMRNKAN